MDIQQKLDEWLASNAEAQKYITAVYYMPDGSEVPADVTHTIRLTSATAAERALRVGLVVVPKFAVFLDAVLSMIATQSQA